MKGLEAAEKFYREAGESMLLKEFPQYFQRLAVGLAGRGSECFQYDDEISCDHDHKCGFAIYLTCSDEREFGFALDRAYRKLVKTLPDYSCTSSESLFGDSETGVIIIEDFLEKHLGIPRAPETFAEWLNIPEYALAETVNGKLFHDGSKLFTNIRKKIIYGMPEDVRLKKLAARAAMMAQSGQYNFMRCHRRGETAAAALALDEFVRNAASMIYLLNFRFAPYYKWIFRGMRDLPKLADTAQLLERLLTQHDTAADKAELIEEVACHITNELAAQNLSSSKDIYLEAQALEITRHIRSRELRTMHIMQG